MLNKTFPEAHSLWNLQFPQKLKTWNPTPEELPNSTSYWKWKSQEDSRHSRAPTCSGEQHMQKWPGWVYKNVLVLAVVSKYTSKLRLGKVDKHIITYSWANWKAVLNLHQVVRTTDGECGSVKDVDYTVGDTSREVCHRFLNGARQEA